MKKLFLFIFLFSLSFWFADDIFAQAEVSHGANQTLEISISGRGGPTMIGPGEKKLIAFFPTSGTVSVSVRYLNDRNRYENRTVNVGIYEGKVFLPSPPNISSKVIRPEKPTPETVLSTAGSENYEPSVGKVNQIRSITTNIESFQIKIKNEARSMGPLIFIGEVFTGVAAPPSGDTLVSREKVNPGLIELTVLYKIPYGKDKVIGQQFSLAQQALAFIVTSPDEVLIIKDEDFFSFADLAPNTKVRFKNIGSTTMYAKSANKKLQRPLRKGRMTPPISIEEAYSTMWYYKDKNNVDRLCTYQSLVPGKGNQFWIRIIDSNALYNIGN